jgi:urea transport system substrate-binding protein
MWKQAVEKAGSTDVNKVIEAMHGQSFESPSGYTLVMDKANHHLRKPAMIGEIQPNGQFKIVWQTATTVRATPYAEHLSPYYWGSDKPIVTVTENTFRESKPKQ